MTITPNSTAKAQLGVSPLLIATLALLSGVAPFATDMYLPSFTQVASNLHTSAADVQLTLTTFFVGVALGQLVIGPLSDRFGRRKPLLVFTFIATVACALCAVAPNIWLLIMFRFAQGFAGSAGVVIGRAIAADRTEGAASAKLFSTLASISGLAPVIAPLVGGLLAHGPGWRGVFWVLTGISVLMMLGAIFVVGESLPQTQRHSGGIAHTGRVIRRLVIDRRYLGYTFSFAFGFAGLMSYISASPFVIENVLGFSITTYTYTFATNAVGFVIAGALSARLVHRYSPDLLLRAGQTGMLVFSILLLAALGAGLSAPFVLPALFCAVFSIGLIMGNAAALAIGSARYAAGTAAALMGSLQFGLGALVAPLVGLGGSNTGLPMATAIAISAAIGVGARLLAHQSSNTNPAVAA